MEDLKTALAAANAARQVTRTLKDTERYQDSELVDGVFTLLSGGHRDYMNDTGRVAEFGKHRVLIPGQIKVGEDDPGEVLEEAEFLMLEDIRTMMQRDDLPESISNMSLLDFAQSAQTEMPYGWIAAVIEIGP